MERRDKWTTIGFLKEIMICKKIRAKSVVKGVSRAHSTNVFKV